MTKKTTAVILELSTTRTTDPSSLMTARTTMTTKKKNSKPVMPRFFPSRISQNMLVGKRENQLRPLNRRKKRLLRRKNPKKRNHSRFLSSPSRRQRNLLPLSLLQLQPNHQERQQFQIIMIQNLLLSQRNSLLQQLLPERFLLLLFLRFQEILIIIIFL
jgi:hypothetical protein